MGGISINVTMQDLGVTRRLKRLISKAGNKKPALQSIGEYMLLQTDKRFTDEIDPEGNKWQAHSAITLAMAWRIAGKKTHTKRGKETKAFKRYQAGRKILTATHALRKSITYKANSDSVIIGTNRVYAPIQQFGGKAGRGRKVTIPPRVFLGLNAADKAEALKIIKEFLGV
jgi:phage virion morphogenesis protein